MANVYQRRLTVNVDIGKTRCFMAIVTTPSEHPSMDILAAVAGYTFTRCLDRTICATLVAIETTKLFVGSIDLEIGVFVMVKQPSAP
jgi:hypothetical protein